MSYVYFFVRLPQVISAYKEGPMVKQTFVSKLAIILVMILIIGWRILAKHTYITTIDEVVALFPKTVEDITQREKHAQEEARHLVQQIIALDHEKRTFDNTLKALDRAGSCVGREGSMFNAITHTHPDASLRTVAADAINHLSDFSVEVFSQNIALYKAIKVYAEGNGKSEQLSPEQQYYLDETLRGFVRNGIDKSPEDQAKITTIKKELSKLEQDFERQISSDGRHILVSEPELKGLTSEFISALKKDVDGAYILGVDYPTYVTVMEHCSVESTREKLWRSFVSRACPENITTLTSIIKLRDELAHLLGYENYAHYDIEDEMAQTPHNVTRFLDDLVARTGQKVILEIERYMQELPEGITLVDGKIKPWDISYIKAVYRKKQFDFDDRLIAEYFPLEHTLEQLLNLYELFLGVTFEMVPGTFYHPEVKGIKVTTPAGKLLGFLLLDLHPRPDKFTHACFMPLVPSLVLPDAQLQPGVGLVVANFSRSTAEHL